MTEKPWTYEGLALVVGLSVLGEPWRNISALTGWSENEIADALKKVRDHRVFIQWSEKIERKRREQRAAENAAAVPKRPTPRIAEPVEKPGRFVKRSFSPRYRVPPPESANRTAALMGDPTPDRSALPIKSRSAR